MKKVVIMVLALLLVPALCFAVTCPNYTVGYQGKAAGCIFGIDFPIVGAAVTLTVDPGIVVGTATKADGTYYVEFVGNNCRGAADGTAKGFIWQKYSVKVDLGDRFAGIYSECSDYKVFVCCCPDCAAKKISTCDASFSFCCF